MPNAANDSIASNNIRPRQRSIGSSSGRNRGNGSIAVNVSAASHTASLEADWHELLEEPFSSTRAAALLALRSKQLSERHQDDSLADLPPWSAPPPLPELRQPSEPLPPTYFSSHISPISLVECRELSSSIPSPPPAPPAEIDTSVTTSIDFTIPNEIKHELSSLLIQQPEEHAVLRLLEKLDRTSPQASLYAVTFRLLFHMLKEEPDPNTWTEQYTSLVLFLYQHSTTLDRKTPLSRACSGVIVRLYRKLLESSQALHGRAAPSLLLDPRLKTSTVRWMLRQATFPLRQRCIQLHSPESVTGDRRQARHCLDLWRDTVEQLIVSRKLAFGSQKSQSSVAESTAGADDSVAVAHLLQLLAEYGNTASVVRLATVLYHSVGASDPQSSKKASKEDLLSQMQTHPWNRSGNALSAAQIEQEPSRSFLANRTADSLVRTLIVKGQHSQAAFIFALIPIQYRTVVGFEMLLSRYGEASLVAEDAASIDTSEHAPLEKRWHHAPPSMAYQQQLWSEAQECLLLQPASIREQYALRFFKARLASHALHASPQMVIHDLLSMKRRKLLPRRGDKQQTRLSSLPFSGQISAVRAFLRAGREDIAQSLAVKLLSDHRRSILETSARKPVPPDVLATLLLNTLSHSYLLSHSPPSTSVNAAPNRQPRSPHHVSTADLRTFLSQLESLTTRLQAKMNGVTRNIILTALFRWQEGAVLRRDRQILKELAEKMNCSVEKEDRESEGCSEAGNDRKKEDKSDLSFMSSIFDHSSSAEASKLSGSAQGRDTRSLTAYRQSEGAILQELARALHRRGMKQEGRMVVGFLKEQEARLKGRKD